MRAGFALVAFSMFVAGSVPFAQQRLSLQAERAAVNELASLVSIPNVATNQPDIHRNAEYLKQAFERRGFQMQIVETTHSPVVLGELRVANATASAGAVSEKPATPARSSPAAAASEGGRAITFYAHYDGQPVNASEWKDAPPFQPIFRDGVLEQGAKVVQLPAAGPLDRRWRMYGRSTSDDKGGITVVLAAIDQLRASATTPTSTIRLIFEGDEEAGSPVLEQAVMDHPARVRSDLVIMIDGPRHASGRPTFFFGNRGIISAEITVFGAKHDLHSGNYGNWAPNPALELARLLASMKDDKGKVTIAGFYDDVVPLTAEEEQAIAEIPDVQQEQMRAFGFARPEVSGVRLEQRHNLPTFNVSGLGSGTVTGQGRTIIPATATARIDMRLVKAIDPAKQVARLRAHIERQGYHLIAGEQPTDQERATYPQLARLVQFEGYPAGRTSLDQPTAKAVVAAVAAASGSGAPVRYPTLGGSAPFYIFTDRLGVPAIGMPIANYDNNQHGPNENLQLGAYFDGIQAVRAILTMR